MYEYTNVERLVSQLNERANGTAHRRHFLG